MSFIRFILFILLSLLLVYLPVFNLLGYPLLWLEAYLHEVSHGLAAVLSGGRVVSITIAYNGDGLCSYIASRPSIVLFFGYAGATIWGGLIYSGASSSVRVAHRIALGMVLLLMVTGILWMKPEFESWIILLTMISLIFFPLWFVRYQTVQYFVQFVGIFIMANNIQSVMKLFTIIDRGDHKKLAALTDVSTTVWIWSWLIFCITVLLIFAIRSIKVYK
ncbi:hypothetical protein MNBD_GAMMA12-3127 [hydrothermal vent metagenome]|uniref:M50 family peptidase n=1 Tax=hydrothermal vent metagenome TaxID=652676 RepID=A0A3B0YT79_9ZZZZ